MSKKDFSSKTLEKSKILLGKKITELRGERSLRNLAEAVGLSPSNLTYIEQGKNAPTAEVYEKLIAELHPSKTDQQKLDRQYMRIRQTPPPDICKTIMDNDLTPIIRNLGTQPISDAQKRQLADLLASFKAKNERGEIQNV